MRIVRVLLTGGILLALLSGFGAGLAMAEAGDWMVRSRLIVIAPDASGTSGLAGIDVNEDVTVEVDISRFVTDQLALELIVASAAHSLDFGGTSLGSVNHLPPTVTVQWHFTPDGKFRPYVGAGLNYTIFYDKSGAVDFLSVDNSFGLAAQAGADIVIGKETFFNIDIKYIDIDTDVESSGTPVGTIQIDPLVIGVGVGRKW